jgi:hypothetical protein
MAKGMALKTHALLVRGLKLVDLQFYAPFYVFVYMSGVTVTFVIVRVTCCGSRASVAGTVTEAER